MRSVASELSLAALLRARRQTARLSQEGLADRAGVSVRTVRNLESGRIVAPRPSSLRGLADALGLVGEDRDRLFALAGPHGPGTATGTGAEPGVARFRPPAPYQAMLDRPRLIERLQARWHTPVTVVSAPAGFGKTTLLAQAYASDSADPARREWWLSCVPGLGRAAALAEALCLAADMGPVGGRQVGVAGLAAAVGAVIWRMPGPVALVVDDVHEIPAWSDAARLLDALVAALPPHAHVVLAGRGAPPVRLGRLSVAGRVLQLTQADLAFDDGELAAFAARRAIEPARVAGCGGWPALAELVARTPDDAAPAAVARYVGEEVIAALAPARRRDLGLLADLAAFDADLARVAVGH